MAQCQTPPMSPVAQPANRPSMGSALRRRLSSAAVVMSTGTNQDAVLEATRQRYEDKKRRISIVSPKALRPNAGEDKAVPPTAPGSTAAANAFDLLSPDDATEHYRQCLRLAIENKINKKNAFDLKLIENLESILTGKNRQNFALCASLVDVGTRIFGSRVDANDIELKRICTWLCGGAGKDDENDDGETAEGDKGNDEKDGNYGGNDSVLMEMKKEDKKKAKVHSRKAVIEEDNNKLTAPLEKRSKANPLMIGRRSALSGGGNITSVLLLPSLSVTERPLNNESTTLSYVVSEAADRTFATWIRNTGKPQTAPVPNKKPRWSFDELGKLDLSKDICPPLHTIDLNKTFGNVLEGIDSTSTGVDDLSCEEALHSHLAVESQDNGFGEENVRVIAPQGEAENADDDSFEMPALEDQSIYPDNAENAVNGIQDCMLLVPVEDNAPGADIGTQPSALPLASSGTFSIEQLHEILTKSLATGDMGPSKGGDAVAPAWLLEQLVNGTVGKALKLRQKQPAAGDTKPATVVKSRRNIVKVQKVAFSEELHQSAGQQLCKKTLPNGGKKQAIGATTGENDLPEPVVNHEFDELLRKLRDCFILGGARAASATSMEGLRGEQSLSRSVSGAADFMADAAPIGGEDDDDDYGDHLIDDEAPLFGLESINKSMSRHESMLMQRNFADAENIAGEGPLDVEKEGTSASSAIGQMLLNQVRNAATSLVASLLPRRVDVRIAKHELWRSVEKNAPETRMSVVVSSANDSLVTSSTQAAPKSSSAQPVNPAASTLSPQMAFVCLLHLANEHNLTLQSSEDFADVRVKTSST